MTDPSADAIDLCELDDCERPLRSERTRFCRGHQQRWKAFGTMDESAQMLMRFGKYLTAGDNGCWDWTGSIKPNGYGQFHFLGRVNEYAHRASWELHRGEIPAGYTIDHLCCNTRCVNPDHLEPVPNRVNQERRAANVTACPKGHDYTQENTLRSRDGRRGCRECNRIWARAYYDKHRGAE